VHVQIDALIPISSGYEWQGLVYMTMVNMLANKASIGESRPASEIWVDWINAPAYY